MSDVELPLRRQLYPLLIALSFAMVTGRILAYATASPTHGDNDRSRWATVRALVDEGSYVIGWRDRPTIAWSAVAPLAAGDPVQASVLTAVGLDARSKNNHGISTESGWITIDKVLHPQKLEFVSSKPPLLSTLLAGLYWLLKNLFGWDIVRNNWAVVKTVLFLVNGVPWLIYLALLARLLERYGMTDWGRLYVLAAGCFGTFLTTFANTLNNHSVGSVSVLFALYPALGAWEKPKWWRFALAGFFAACAVTCELPAAAFAAGLFLVLLWRDPWRTMLGFVPLAVIPVAGFFVTNYLAVGQWRPAYSEFGGPWYQFEGSHWLPPYPGEVKSGIDWARLMESREAYVFQSLIGHHGIFSLTPIFLLSLTGMTVMLLRPVGTEITEKEAPARRLPYWFYALTAAVTGVVLGFYLLYRDDRNYGGWTSGPRWFFWLTPLWLLCLLPVADWLAQRRWGRGLALVLLAVSAFSAAYPVWNPWRHPWLFEWMQFEKWAGY
jgi:hypothetical protein